ncbi:Uncharacterised protein [uncultured archaeon]|nr:Uncharacterised protein [uncultured archaeon]
MKTNDYFESLLINYLILRNIALLLLFYFFASEIFSIFSELQYGHRFVSGSLKKFLLQLLQCHVILIPSIQYRFVISSSYNKLSFNEGYQ